MLAVALATACTSSGSAPAPKATGPVDVALPSASAKPVIDACRTLLAAIPDELDKGVTRRPVTGDATRTAAWGDPAVTLQCGVPLPDQTATPLVLDGLPFVTKKTAGRVLWTTSDRAVNVSLDIPTAYEEQGYLVLTLVPVLKQLPAPAAAPGA
ncbi:MAG: DUF3515 domain-containing protein [Actinobacteria bacterium]|nr:DUF3515 domain-containing protein [Actinomycetota bacterium]MCA1720370.1 DUF3515 domain-containing protein [Actinomycetota bacterium]